LSKNQLADYKRFYEEILKVGSELYREKDGRQIDVSLAVSHALENANEKFETKFNEMQKESKVHEEEMKKEFDKKINELTEGVRDALRIAFNKLNAVKIA